MHELITVADLPVARLDDRAVDRDPFLTYIAGVAAGSRPALRCRLAVAVDIMAGDRFTPGTFPWHTIGFQHVAALRARLIESDLAPSTANAVLSAVRALVKQAWRLGLIDGDTERRVADVAGIRGSRLPAGRALEPKELQRLFRVCLRDPGPSGLRDRALLAVGCGGGLRRAELVSLDIADLDAEAGSLRVVGKGDKERTVFLALGVLEALTDWLELRGHEPGPLFTATTKGAAGRITIDRISTSSVYTVVKRRATQAGVAEFSPHDLRRTFASALLDQGADIAAVQRLMGHSSIQTTTRYDRRGEYAARDAAQLVSLPIAG